jgi:transcription initiation factor IIE alpha subunit
MKKLIIVLIVLMGTASTFAQSGNEKMPVSKSDTTAKFLYTCPMHPEVITDMPGKCPKCGMDLVKKKVNKIYTCSMHPEVVSDKPGKCPKCGMELVEKKSSAKMKGGM